MPARRIIPCLDIRDGLVVKGVQFKGHEVVGEIAPLARRYRDEGADELVLYDITASVRGAPVDLAWVEAVAREIDIPFAIAGGIRSLDDAARRLERGADKISINSPALENPGLIDALAARFGSQCVVVGVDSRAEDGDYFVHQYTGDPAASRAAGRRTLDWIKEAQDRGAGEIVLNCMNEDGRRAGYDIRQLSAARDVARAPLIASGGAGAMTHFRDVFEIADVSGALAASVFHRSIFSISDLKEYLISCAIDVRR
ncbi:MAG: imidazole glycerol phosphate synthase subunit HisF [Alphaproteobacteria bacterium]|nr:imidazole glycerol phosphate synthase subunit HisF [Alphaproteobacteria bacterium]